MKVYPFLLLLLLLLTSCDSPIDIGVFEFDELAQSMFKRELLLDESGFSTGYYNGCITTDKICLEWEESTDPRFLCYTLMHAGTTTDNLATYDDVSKNSYTEMELEEDSRYYYELVVLASDGMQARDTIMIKTPRWDAPDGLTANGCSETDVVLSWDDNSESEENFEIYLYNYADSLIGLYITEADENQVLVKDLTPDESYYFIVLAYNQWETDILGSEPFDFDMSDFYMYPPEIQYLNQNVDHSIDLYWEDYSTYETGYLLERKHNSGSFAEIADLGINSEYYCDLSAVNFEVGDMLTYRLRAYNDYGDEIQYTDYSEEVTISIIDMTGFSENFNDGIAQNWIDDGSNTWDIVDEEYVMDGYGSEEERFSYYDSEFNDFTYEADLCKYSGDYSHGLAFRSDGIINNGEINNGYLFIIDDEYFTVCVKINGDYSSLIDWEYSSNLNPMGETNHLKVVCNGNNLGFYINGILEDVINSDIYVSGYSGVWAYDGYYDFVAFDNIELECEGEDLESGKKVVPKPASREMVIDSEVVR